TAECTGSREASDRCGARVKVLALDYGRARTGVAVSDPTGTIARPLCVVEEAATGDGLARLAALIGEHEVDRVVVGLPLTLRGERGAQARAAGARPAPGSATAPTGARGARARPRWARVARRCRDRRWDRQRPGGALVDALQRPRVPHRDPHDRDWHRRDGDRNAEAVP